VQVVVAPAPRPAPATVRVNRGCSWVGCILVLVLAVGGIALAGATGARLTTLLPGGAFGFNRFAGLTTLPDGGLAATLSPAFGDLVRLDEQGQVLNHLEDVLKSHTDDHDITFRLAADASGNVYMLGTSSVAVFVVPPGGKGVVRIAGKGEGQDGLEWPAYALAVDSQGRVYVSNSFSGIQVYSSGGAYLGRISPPVRAALTGLAASADGYLYALAGYNAQIYKFALPTAGATATPLVLIK
jgi:hypothetical protein